MKKSSRPLVGVTILRLDAVSDLVVGAQAGGIFVDNYARLFLLRRFALVWSLSAVERSRYIDDGVEDFINNAKNNFNDTGDEVVVKVAGLRDNFAEIEVDLGDMIIES